LYGTVYVGSILFTHTTNTQGQSHYEMHFGALKNQKGCLRKVTEIRGAEAEKSKTKNRRE
jgi:hypothetical protein